MRSSHRSLLFFQEMWIRESDIRNALRTYLDAFLETDPTSLLVEEFGVCRGTVRADLAVIGETLQAFEIKSDQDTLKRLAAQAEAYNRVFDTVTIVVGPRHRDAVETVVPQWWGILLFDAQPEAQPKPKCTRIGAQNPGLDSLALVQLLWREEALGLLEDNGLGAGMKSKPRRYLWEALSKNFALTDLREMVRTKLKVRPDWRSGESRKRDGAMSPPSARLSGSLSPPAHSRIRRYTRRPN
jgi:hypothetical protein